MNASAEMTSPSAATDRGGAHTLLLFGILVAAYSLLVGVGALAATSWIGPRVPDPPLRMTLQIAAIVLSVLTGGLGGAHALTRRLLTPRRS